MKNPDVRDRLIGFKMEDYLAIDKRVKSGEISPQDATKNFGIDDEFMKEYGNQLEMKFDVCGGG